MRNEARGLDPRAANEGEGLQDTPEELLALAKKEGYELSVEQLEEVAGGTDMWCCRDVYGEEGDW
jgi:hypothetical protein